MSIKETTYDALRKTFIKSLTDDWDPIGDEFIDNVKEAFIEYIRDDVKIWPVMEETEEFMLVAYLDDGFHFPDLSKDYSFSNVLAYYADHYGIEKTELMVANSLAVLRKKMER